jgi:hypothetical protein
MPGVEGAEGGDDYARRYLGLEESVLPDGPATRGAVTS